MAWRTPQRVWILGHCVEVKLVTAEAMKDVVADNDGAKGAWDADTDTIYLLKGLSTTQRNRTFWHEVLHCLIDYFDP